MTPGLLTKWTILLVPLQTGIIACTISFSSLAGVTMVCHSRFSHVAPTLWMPHLFQSLQYALIIPIVRKLQIVWRPPDWYLSNRTYQNGSTKWEDKTEQDKTRQSFLSRLTWLRCFHLITNQWVQQWILAETPHWFKVQKVYLCGADGYVTVTRN